MEARTGIQVETGPVQYAPLLGLGAEKVSVRFAVQGAARELDLGKVVVSPSLVSILAGTPQAEMQSEGGLGNIVGALEVTDGPEFRTGRLSLNWSETLLADLVRIAGSNIKAKGELSGNLGLAGEMARPLTLEGRGDVQMRDVECSFSNRLVQGVKVRSGNGGGDWVLEDRKLSLNEWTFEAEGVSGTIEGTVHLAGQLAESRLDLKGTLQCDPGKLGLPPSAAGFFRKGKPLSFRVRGTLGEPKYGL